MLTEDEAKTRWCPFARYALNAGGVNRWKQSLPEDEPHALNPVPWRCIASACMAWRTSWLYDDAPVGMKPSDDPSWVEHGTPRGQGGAVTHRRDWKRPVGFCGLAGKPETA